MGLEDYVKNNSALLLFNEIRVIENIVNIGYRI